jgi:hypothetical protein
MLNVLGTLIIFAGLALWLLGAFAFLVAAFRENILWGLAVLFLPVAALVFLVLHWPRAKNAFFLELWGIGTILVGSLVFHANLPWPLG